MVYKKENTKYLIKFHQIIGYISVARTKPIYNTKEIRKSVHFHVHWFQSMISVHSLNEWYSIKVGVVGLSELKTMYRKMNTTKQVLQEKLKTLQNFWMWRKKSIKIFFKQVMRRNLPFKVFTSVVFNTMPNMRWILS